MKFALFYEIPVARPWARDSEHKAYKEVVEQAGFHSLWTVEHQIRDSGAALFCLLNPYKIPHKEIMRSIELLGEKVIPALS